MPNRQELMFVYSKPTHVCGPEEGREAERLLRHVDVHPRQAGDPLDQRRRVSSPGDELAFKRCARGALRKHLARADEVLLSVAAGPPELKLQKVQSTDGQVV